MDTWYIMINTEKCLLRKKLRYSKCKFNRILSTKIYKERHVAFLICHLFLCKLHFNGLSDRISLRESIHKIWILPRPVHVIIASAHAWFNSYMSLIVHFQVKGVGILKEWCSKSWRSADQYKETTVTVVKTVVHFKTSRWKPY